MNPQALVHARETIYFKGSRAAHLILSAYDHRVINVSVCVCQDIERTVMPAHYEQTRGEGLATDMPGRVAQFWNLYTNVKPLLFDRRDGRVILRDTDQQRIRLD